MKTQRPANKATSDMNLDATILHALTGRTYPETAEAIAMHIMTPKARVVAACERLHTAGKLSRIGNGYIATCSA